MDTCVDDALTHLSSMEKLPELPTAIITDFKSELRFFRLFLLCFPGWNSDTFANLRVNLSSLVSSIADLRNIEMMHSIETHNQWYSECAEVLYKITECKAEFKKYHEHLISRSCASQPFTRHETIIFLDSVLVNVNYLVKCPVDEFLPVKSLIETLEERVFLLRNLVYFTAMCGENNEESIGVEFNVHSWAYKAACLTLLHWLNYMKDEETGEILQRLHNDLGQKFNSSNLKFTRLCFEAIKHPKLKNSDKLFFGEFVSRFVDFFLDNLMLTFKDDVRIIREGLILLITFVSDPSENAELPIILKKIYAVLDQATQVVKANLEEFQRSIAEVRGIIEKLFVHISNSVCSNFPRINGLGHFESLLIYLENLKEAMNKDKKLVPFLKHQILTIQEELLPLRPFLQDISILQNGHKELQDLREQIIDISYQVDLAIKSSFFIDHPIWYNLSRMSFIVEKIKDIRYKVMKIKDSHICESKAIIPPLMCSLDVVKAPTSMFIGEVGVGFKKEIEVLTDLLISGTTRLDIVSIVGMGGIGKTTLAKKLSDTPSIARHFHKRAFCSISQEYIKRKVLIGISLNVCQKSDNEVYQMSNDDLALMLYQCLKGFRYLIVIDDIWDINAWYDLNASFPDDKNGSRIIFTSRINNISLIAKPDSIPCQLPFLSPDESWELLHQKIFHTTDLCPPHLCEVGKLIAEKCNGLPLAIVVIAGLLARTERSLFQWSEVADNLSSFALNEGCKDILKLSYMQLPEALKSCFLYLGAFGEDNILDAKRLKLLWVAEGLVLKSGNCSFGKVAKKYLNDLGDRNLITVIERSTNGGIKSFCVHDLIRDFCRTEAQEQNFMCFISAHNNNLPMLSVCDQYRFCIEAEWKSFVDAKPRDHIVHSMLYISKACREENSIQFFLCKFKHVEVLDLREIEIVGEFPTSVTTLVHLTYLSLHFFTSPYVPSEISNLTNLKTFLLFGGPMFKSSSKTLWISTLLRDPNAYNIYPIFSNGIWNLKRLRHVGIDYGVAKLALDFVVGVSSQLHDLENFTSLIIPLGKLGDELLRRLPNIRKLDCLFHGWLDQHSSCYQLPKLEILTKLEHLVMHHLDDKVCHLEMLSFPSTLKKLGLQNFKLPWNEFSALIGKLPCLEVLRLHKNAFSGKIWDVEDEEFPNIKSLALVDQDIEEWKTCTDSFPCLEKLMVYDCCHLFEIPNCFGEVQTLKFLSVGSREKRVVDSAYQIRENQFDFGNLDFELKLVLYPH